MTTTYTIRTRDESTHRAHLAGPGLLCEIGELDNALRSLLRHDAWPVEIAPEDRTTGSMVAWVRQQLTNARIAAGVGDE